MINNKIITFLSEDEKICVSKSILMSELNKTISGNCIHSTALKKKINIGFIIYIPDFHNFVPYFSNFVLNYKQQKKKKKEEKKSL